MKDFLRTRGILRYGGPKFNCYRGFFNELRAKEMGVEGACAINPVYVIKENNWTWHRLTISMRTRPVYRVYFSRTDIHPQSRWPPTKMRRALRVSLEGWDAGPNHLATQTGHPWSERGIAGFHVRCQDRWGSWNPAFPVEWRCVKGKYMSYIEYY